MRSALISSFKRARGVASSSQAVRSIAIGTDLKTSSSVVWQKARPWYMSNAEGSNNATDNALSMTDIFANKTVAVFGVPAPFTGTCTNEHYPPYQALAPEFAKAGADQLVCYSVADPYSHHGWSTSLGNDNDQITFLADDGCEWAKAHDLDRDYTGASLGVRSARFSMVVKDGIVETFHLVDDASKDAEVLLEDVRKTA